MTFANISETSSRDKILDAAEHLFAQRGYAGVGLREVAEAVGLGQSSLFHPVMNRPGLSAAGCGRIVTRSGSRLGEALARGGSPVETRADARQDAPADGRVELGLVLEVVKERRLPE